MSGQIDLDPVDRLTAGAVGEPGSRTFYLQARKGDLLVSLLLEKQQVALLSSHIDQLLEGVSEDVQPPEPESLELEQPVVPQFRVGRLGLGFDEERGLVMLQCDELVEEEAEESDPPGRVRVWATPGQMEALARRGEQEVAAGRPVCSMCGETIDPEGHFCPRSNGHREVTRLQ